MVWISGRSGIGNERMDTYIFDSWLIQYNDVKCPVDKAGLVETAWTSERVRIVLSSRLPTAVNAELWS